VAARRVHEAGTLPATWTVRRRIASAGGSMLDLAYVAATLAFFGIAFAYAAACGRL
jgi:hypothetical protein